MPADHTRLLVRAAQFAASDDYRQNLRTIEPILERAASDGIDLLVLPEGVLVRFLDRRERIREDAQPLDGPFVSRLRELSRGTQTTVVVGIHEAVGGGDTRPYNTLVALRDGEIVGIYRKIHLYDAFAVRESDNVRPADELPPVIDVAGWRVGLMTCYDVRFPEVARSLVDQGAEVLTLPAAWVRGPLKREHWRTMSTARALENTSYVVASGEAGERNIGASLVIDPLGVIVAQGNESTDEITAHLSRARLDSARASLPVLLNRRFVVEPKVHPLPALERVPTSQTPLTAPQGARQ